MVGQGKRLYAHARVRNRSRPRSPAEDGEGQVKRKNRGVCDNRPARESRPEIKGRGRPIRSSGGRSIG
jgi:hypothetical protein